MELQDITNAIGDNNELFDGVINYIRENERGQQFLTNYSNEIADTRVSEHMRQTMDTLDNKMFELTGRRPENVNGVKQKSIDFAASLLQEAINAKGDESKLKELNDEIERLKSSGASNEFYKGEFEKLQEKFTTTVKDFEKKLTDKDIANNKFQLQTQLQGALSGMKFSDNLPESVVKMLTQTHIDFLTGSVQKRGEKNFYHDEQGQPYADAVGNPLSADAVLKLRMKEILKDGDSKPGGGAPPTVNGLIESVKIDGKDSEVVTMSGAYKDRSDYTKQLDEALAKAGISMYSDSDKYNKVRAATYKRDAQIIANLPR